MGFFGQAEQKFFKTGHSFNSCDRAFGLIEIRMRQLQLEVPSQIEELVRSACTENPFQPKRMELPDFLDFKKRRDQQFKTPANFRVTKHLWYKLSTDVPRKIYAREAHDDTEIWNEFRINYNRATHSLVPVQVVRNQTIPMEATKLRDLEKFLPLLHSESHAYYMALIAEENDRVQVRKLLNNTIRKNPFHVILSFKGTCTCNARGFHR